MNERVAETGRHSVDLLGLMEQLPTIRPLTAVLGLADGGRPILLNLPAPDVGNLLIAGESGSGKSSLLRTVLLSLAIANRQSQFQSVVIAAGDSGLRQASRPTTLYPLTYLPHLLTPVVRSVAKAAETLTLLIEEMNYRREQGVTQPTILVSIDDVDALLARGGQRLFEALVGLLQDGPGVGIRLAISAAEVSGPAMRSLLRCNLSVRIVGKVANRETARTAAGVLGSGAEYLLGRGAFVALAGASMVRFQAAFINDNDLHWVLQRLHRMGQSTAVVGPANSGFELQTSSEEGVDFGHSWRAEDAATSGHYQGGQAISEAQRIV